MKIREYLKETRDHIDPQFQVHVEDFDHKLTGDSGPATASGFLEIDQSPTPGVEGPLLPWSATMEIEVEYEPEIAGSRNEAPSPASATASIRNLVVTLGSDEHAEQAMKAVRMQRSAEAMIEDAILKYVENYDWLESVESENSERRAQDAYDKAEDDMWFKDRGY